MTKKSKLETTRNALLELIKSARNDIRKADLEDDKVQVTASRKKLSTLEETLTITDKELAKHEKS